MILLYESKLFVQKKRKKEIFICFCFSNSLLYLTNEDLREVMNDDIVVVAEGVNGTIMKINEIQVSCHIRYYSCLQIHLFVGE